jgi:hypothetical protein
MKKLIGKKPETNPVIEGFLKSLRGPFKPRKGAAARRKPARKQL